MVNSIVVDVNINKGKPSIRDSNGKYVTVKGIVNMLRGGVDVEETAKELCITEVEVHSALLYVEKYPQVMD